MLDLLARLRQKCSIGFVGGSNLAKQQEQLGSSTVKVTDLFDWCFAENGLTAIRLGQDLPSNSFIKAIGEEPYKKFANFCLHYIADLDIPVKRGTFIEFRNGMINISPVGRNASVQERNDFEAYDKIHNIRPKFIEVLRAQFPDLGLKYVFALMDWLLFLPWDISSLLSYAFSFLPHPTPSVFSALYLNHRVFY